MIHLIEALFPECTVEIVSEAGSEFRPIPSHLEEKTPR